MPMLTRFEHVTVSLAAFSRPSCVHFCKAKALPQIHAALSEKKKAERNSPTCRINNFFASETEERSNTGVLQVMRQEYTKNYYLSGVTGSTLVSLSPCTKEMPLKPFTLIAVKLPIIPSL